MFHVHVRRMYILLLLARVLCMSVKSGWLIGLFKSSVSLLVFCCCCCCFSIHYWELAAPLVVQLVKNMPAMQETWIRFLGRENPLEKEMANLLQYSGLENPMDRGAWWATVHGVTRVKHDLVTKPPTWELDIKDSSYNCRTVLFSFQFCPFFKKNLFFGQAECGIWFPSQGLKLCPLHWKS